MLDKISERRTSNRTSLHSLGMVLGLLVVLEAAAAEATAGVATLGAFLC